MTRLAMLVPALWAVYFAVMWFCQIRVNRSLRRLVDSTDRLNEAASELIAEQQKALDATNKLLHVLWPAAWGTTPDRVAQMLTDIARLSGRDVTEVADEWLAERK